MMDDRAGSTPTGDRQRLMDELLRAGVPEIKLALGEVIDRENARPLPPRYARLLPESLLVVTLREDAGSALAPIAADLERELTDSCNRHGSLYDRAYRVQLHRSSDPEAPLYSVASHAGRNLGGVPADPSEPDQAEAPSEGRPGKRTGPSAASSSGGLAAIPARPTAALPLSDPVPGRTGQAALAGWQPGRWLLIVEGERGEEREVFRLGEATVTVGRRTDDPELRAAIAISDAPHVSRRQLALAWEERDGAPGFRVYNLGLNSVHLPQGEIPGSRAGKDSVDLESLSEEHTGWLPPGVPLRIGEHGPVLRIEDLPEEPPEEWIDPDATVFE